MKGLHGADAAEVKQAREDYEAGGYFAVTLPAPIVKTRLLVIDDIFLSHHYTTCGGKADSKGADAMMAWLTRELDGARERGERVWVMGHIPPGIDVYATLRKGDACGGGAETFLAPGSKDDLGDLLGAYGDVVKLAIFAHTHMDEMKLLPATDKQDTLKSAGVPVKGVSSISPVNGNRPTFTVGRVDPADGTLADYGVYMPQNKTGVGTWTREYGFDETYHEKSFSAAALKEMIDGFHTDAGGSTETSQAYEIYFDPGFPIPPLILGWPQYACGMDHMTVKGFKACACPAK